MDQIVSAAEKEFVPNVDLESTETNVEEIVGHAAHSMSKDVSARNYKAKLVSIVHASKVAQRLAKYRPKLDHICFTTDPRVSRELNLVWGVRSVLLEKLEAEDVENLVSGVILAGVDMGLLHREETVIAMCSSHRYSGHAGITCVYKVRAVLKKMRPETEEN